MNSLEIFVPGRLCLFGEHSDWAGKYRTMNADLNPGCAIVTGTEQGIYAIVEKSDRFEMRSNAPEISDVWRNFSCAMNADRLKDIAHSDSFFSYCAGVASYMLEWYNVGGVKITLTSMTLPMKSGLSSSAAICVLVARAFNQLYRLNLSTMGEMNIAYWGELRTSSRCGRLDQACAFGVRPVLMSFDGEEISVDRLSIKKTLYWVFADLCSKKDTIKILRDLNRGYPFANEDKEIRLQEALGKDNIEVINKAIKYIKEGNLEELGALMTHAQNLFDQKVAPMCPSELSSPLLHKTLEDPNIKALTYGGKGVGSQGDGSIQFLARDKECQEQLIHYLESLGMRPFKLTIAPRCTVRKAVIPVAGFGTRLYPATRFLKKDFFPIVDTDGYVKPVILILLEELIDSGIEEICIVVGSDEERNQYREFFEKSLPEEHLHKLQPEMKLYEKKIKNIGQHLRFVYQTEKRGFGHAVYQTVEFAAGEPVLLLLGDTLYRSNVNKSCTRQFLEAFEHFNCPMVSIHSIPLNDVHHYGIISGHWDTNKEKNLHVDKFIEKPSIEYAQNNMGTKNRLGDIEYFSVFGQYIITSDVYDQLKKDIEETSDFQKEIELTNAIDKVRATTGLTGVKLDGRMFDMGKPDAFKDCGFYYSK
jgi:UTP-glucose-1-phosphate uridylyltransferase/mevalonate kinase